MADSWLPYPSYPGNTQDTSNDIPGRLDVANAADYNVHDREILTHQGILVNHEGRIVLLESQTLTTTLADLTDVELTALASGQILIYNGSKWVNAVDIYPEYSATLPITLSAGVIGFNTSYLSDSLIPFDGSLSGMGSSNVHDAIVEAFEHSANTDHSVLDNLDYSSAGHTGFEAEIPSGDPDQYYSGDKTWKDLPETATAFTDLTDSPSGYGGFSASGVRVNQAEDGLEFYSVQNVTYPVTSVFSRTGDVVSAYGDYTWSDINKDTSSLSDITDRSHALLDAIGTYTHDQIDSHIDDTNVHITAKTAGSVIFAGADGYLTENNSQFFWSTATDQLRIGGDTVHNDDPAVPLTIAGNDEFWTSIVVLNHNDGPYALSLISAASSNSGATYPDYKMVSCGVASPNINHPVYQFLEPNDAFTVALGGNLVLAALWPDKIIKFGCGGASADNLRMTIEDDAVTIFANPDEEQIDSSFPPADWIATNGFSAIEDTGLICTNNVNISTIQPSASTWVVTGVTYHIVMTISGVSGTISYSIGGVTGSAISDDGIDEYLTATSTGKLIFTSQPGATCTISSLSVRPLVDDTGNLNVQGDLNLASRLNTITGEYILSANGEGIVTFSKIPLLPSEDPTNDNNAVRKGYVDTVLQGLYPVFNCRAATTEAGNLNTDYAIGSEVDTVVLELDDTILIKNQLDDKENGFFTVSSSGVPYRVEGYDTGDTIQRGIYTSIEEGNINLRTSWVMYADNPVVGVSGILFRQNYVSHPPYTGASGIKLDGFAISVDLASPNPALEFDSDQLRVRVDDETIERTYSGLSVILGSTTPNIAIESPGGGLYVETDEESIERSASGVRVKEEGVTNAMLAGSITDSKLNTITTYGKVSGSSFSGLDDISMAAGIIPTHALASGTASESTFLRGDGVFAVPPSGGGSGTGTVDTIVAGTNITVDDTDPSSPIISATYATATPYAEIPSGEVNSSNTTFTLAHTPLYASGVMVLIDGVTQYNNIDYTVSGTTIEFAYAPMTGSTIFAYYGSTGSAAAQFSGLSKITVGKTQPSNPSVGDLWVDTN